MIFVRNIILIKNCLTDAQNCYMIYIMKISNYIKVIRSKLGLTQRELANRIGKDRSSIANYETGRAIPPGDVLLKIQALEAQLLKAKI